MNSIRLLGIKVIYFINDAHLKENDEKMIHPKIANKNQ